MEVKELERDRNRVVLEYVFEAEEIAQAEDKAVRYLNQRVEIPGFRKGRIPKNALKMKLGEDFQEYTLDFLMDLIPDTLKDRKLILSPIVTERELKDGTARVVVEVHEEPEVKIGDISKIEVEKVDEEKVLEKYVERRIEDLRESHALLEPKEGHAEAGDLVRVNMEVYNEEGKKLTSREYEYVISEDEDRPFVKDLVEKKKGDIVEIEREYEGKKYTYRLEVMEVYKRTLPEIGDEFAKSVNNEFETLEQLKESLKKEGKEIYDVEMKESMREQLLEKLPEVVEIEISDRTLEILANEAVNRLKKEGRYEQIVNSYESEEKFREELKKRILDDMKRDRVIEVLAQEKGISVSDEELEKEAEELAPFWGISPERAKSLVKARQDLREELRWAILKRKVLDLLLQEVKVKVVEPKGEGDDSEGKEDN
ncbi:MULTISPECIES: trigger factor [unclassified Thermotoga]|uniref:trigger factor n=1 Tax=unclassified Thermotoga TaxID=2631113 RepID=UPI0005426997|nr:MULTISPECIES: trigger factor [unclassified Thermotoga]KAF2959826.1 trigger factor [Thermotoga sp. 38H-to]KHC90292.1 trigger factor [Thermotoga sp. Mc24]